MAIKFNPSDILHGNNGEMWLGGEQLMTAISLEAKVTIDTDTVEVLGDPGSYSRYNGHSGSGTITRYKIDSSYLKLAAEYVKSGIAPDISIISSVKQPTTGKVERVALKYVTFTEISLIDLKKKSLIQEEIPFDFGDFEILESI